MLSSFILICYIQRFEELSSFCGLLNFGTVFGAGWSSELRKISWDSFQLLYLWSWLFSHCVYYIAGAEMNRHLCVWLFRHPSLNGHRHCHIHPHSYQFTQIHLDTRLVVFRQNRNNILPHLLNKNWFRRYCHQDTWMLWKHKALRKYMEDLNKEYRTLDRSFFYVWHHISLRLHTVVQCRKPPSIPFFLIVFL